MVILKKAYDFLAEAVMHDNSIQKIQLSKYLNGKYGLLIFYPLNFTFVCPTELLEFNKVLHKFEELNCLPLFISIDSVYSHLAWKKQDVKEGGVLGVQIPMVGDISKEIVRGYGVENAEGVALRGTFLIDKDFIVKSAHVNDLPLGRNINEYLRLVEALQHHEKYGNVCPANWQKGDKDMHPSNKGLKDYFKN